jgi:hypothetical protein
VGKAIARLPLLKMTMYLPHETNLEWSAIVTIYIFLNLRVLYKPNIINFIRSQQENYSFFSVAEAGKSLSEGKIVQLKNTTFSDVA